MNVSLQKIVSRWNTPGGYREVLGIAFPLILSTGAWSIQHFVDRMFLTWYSPEAVAASMPASILNFAILSLFIGTASYVNTFVAQYHGAQRDDRIGSAIWQGIYFSFTALICILIFIPLAGPIFKWVGHSPDIQELEKQYFVIICLGGFFPVSASAISSFFSGLGQTRIVMWTNFMATGVNIALDYLLIFGRFGFPELGIQGAAIATVCSGISSFGLLFYLLMMQQNRKKYGTWSGRKFDWLLFRRLIHFGLPSGIQFFLDMLGFAIFILLVGRFGKIELVATNISFNINTLAFMPMIGMGIAVSILVGHRLGENNPKLAEYSTWSALHLSMFYMIMISVCYVLFPFVFLKPFGYQADPQSFEQIYQYGVVILRFVAAYSVFDALNIIFSSAIKGAGDTRFVMKGVVILSWLILVIPTYLAVSVFHWSLFAAWFFATLYVMALSFLFLGRFLQGKWKTMRVIEEPVIAL